MGNHGNGEYDQMHASCRTYLTSPFRSRAGAHTRTLIDQKPLQENWFTAWGASEGAPIG